MSASEGNAGTTSFNFTVSLSIPAGVGGVTFDIATADGGATAVSNDYVAQSLTGQTIAAGSLSYTFSVVVNGDVGAEPDETFFVNATNVVGATVADGQGQGTVVNDDVEVVSIHDIQGAAHVSPRLGQRLRTTPAVVTAVRRGNGNRLLHPGPVPGRQRCDFGGRSSSSRAQSRRRSWASSSRSSGTVTEFGSSPNLTITQLTRP